MSVLFQGGKVRFGLGSNRAILVGTSSATPVPVPTPVSTPTPTPLPAPTDGTILTAFGFRNYMAVPSPGFWRQGIVFPIGAVPAGSSVQVQYGGQPVAVQFDQRHSWPDGSLGLAVMHGRDADFAAGQTRSYMVRLAAGVPFSNASSRTINDVVAGFNGAGGNYKVKFTGLTEMHGPFHYETHPNPDDGSSKNYSTVVSPSVFTDATKATLDRTVTTATNQGNGLVSAIYTADTYTLYVGALNPTTGPFVTDTTPNPDDGTGTNDTTTVATITNADGTKTERTTITRTNKGNGQVSSVRVSDLVTKQDIATPDRGSFTSYFTEAATKQTRTTRLHSGPVSNGYVVWGTARDLNAAGAAAGVAEDAHLKCNWYVNEWLNADGTVARHDVAAVPAQDWWSVPNKRQRNYDATLTSGLGAGTPVETYSGVQHFYNGQWATVQKTGMTRGKRHWIGGAQPTLTYLPDRAYWIASGYVPPLDLTKPCNPLNGGGSITYVPLSAQDHRAAIDGTGAYNGRGVITQPDNVAFLRQNAEDVATARVNAFAGLHVMYHHRSNRQRTRPGEVADVANTPISLKLGRTGSGTHPAYDFTAAGMPAPVYASADHRSDPAYTDGYVVPDSSAGPWGWSYGDGIGANSRSDDQSHSVNYSYFMYLLEGEPYMMEATLDLATNMVHMAPGGIYYGNPQIIWSGDQIVYDQVPAITSQERAFGWASNLVGSAAGAVPDDHVASGFMRRYNQQLGLYCAETVAGLPPDWLAAGCHVWIDGQGVTAPWMGTFNVLGAMHAYRVTRDEGLKAWGAFIANWSINNTDKAIYNTFAYRATNKNITESRSNTNLYLPVALDIDNAPQCSVSAATGVLTADRAVTSGTKLYIASRNYGATPQTVPSELTQGQPYYIRDANGQTFRLCTTPGAAPVGFTQDYGHIQFLIDHDGTYDTAGPMSTPTFPDDSPCMHRAALVISNLSGVSGATTALVAKSQVFNSNVPDLDWKSWSYALPGGTSWVAPVSDPIPLPPGQVAGVAIGAATRGALPVSWTALAATGTTGPAATYLVEYRLASSSGAWTTAAASVTGTSLTVTGLAASTSYAVRVTASNAGGPGAPSAAVTGATTAPSPTAYDVLVTQQPAAAVAVGNDGNITVTVVKESDNSNPASVLIGVSSTGANVPANPANINPSIYDQSGYQQCNVINYNGQTFYSFGTRFQSAGTWTYVIKTPDGVTQKIPIAVQTVVS